MLEVMSAMLKKLKGVKVEGIRYCPHHPKENCSCRKPNSQMGEDIIKGYNLDIKKCYMVGDKLSDIKFAHNIGIEGILVLTGNGKTQIKKYAKELKNTKKCLDILPERKKESLIQYFSHCTNRHSVEFVISDMYEPYLLVTKVMFPKAKYVVDRFHYTRYIMDALDKVRIRLQKEYGYNSKEYRLLDSNANQVRPWSSDDSYSINKDYKVSKKTYDNFYFACLIHI